MFFGKKVILYDSIDIRIFMKSWDNRGEKNMELDVFLIAALADEKKFKKQFPRLDLIRYSNYEFNDIQFFLDILNEDDIPEEYQKIFKNKFVAGYDNNIKHPEWDEKIKKSPIYKEESFKEFAKNKLFIFKPYVEENNYGEKNIKISKKSSLKIIEKPSGISESSLESLVTIPIFNDYNRYSFEKRLLESKSIGGYDSLEKITTSCLISGDYLYGEFESFELLNDGWHVTSNNQIKKIAIDFEAYKDSLIIEPHAIYTDFSFFNEVILEEGLIKNGINLTLDKTLRTKVIVEDQLVCNAK